MLSDILKQNNVDNSGVRFDSTARTALAFVTLKDDGEREFLFYRHPSADMLLQESELDINLLEQVYFLSLVLVRRWSILEHIAQDFKILANFHLKKNVQTLRIVLIAGQDLSLWIN